MTDFINHYISVYYVLSQNLFCLLRQAQHKLQQIHVPKPYSCILFATGGAPLTRGY